MIDLVPPISCLAEITSDSHLTSNGIGKRCGPSEEDVGVELFVNLNLTEWISWFCTVSFLVAQVKGGKRLRKLKMWNELLIREESLLKIKKKPTLRVVPVTVVHDKIWNSFSECSGDVNRLASCWKREEAKFKISSKARSNKIGSIKHTKLKAGIN